MSVLHNWSLIHSLIHWGHHWLSWWVENGILVRSSTVVRRLLERPLRGRHLLIARSQLLWSCLDILLLVHLWKILLALHRTVIHSCALQATSTLWSLLDTCNLSSHVLEWSSSHIPWTESTLMGVVLRWRRSTTS